MLFRSFALITQRPLIRSFVRSKTDRPSRTSGICRLQNCRSSSAAFSFFHYNLPASSTLRRRLPAPKPNLSGAFHENASTLLSTRSRRVGRSSVDGSGCLGESSKPASFLQQIFTDNRPPDHRDGAEDTGHDSVFSHAQPGKTQTVLA